MRRWAGRTPYYILNAAGDPEPCPDVKVWSRWFEDHRSDRLRIVAQDKDESAGADGVMVSTVFLALDHQWGAGPPILYETLVIGGPLDGEMERYPSRDEALKGHLLMCQRVAAAAPKPKASA